MMASIYEMARQRIACATIKAPTKKVTISECGRLVKAKEPKKPRSKHEPTPEEIEERKARQRKYEGLSKETERSKASPRQLNLARFRAFFCL